MTMQLQTVSHEKPAKGFSHPMGTETLSDALEGVPQFAAISLYFRAAEGVALGEQMPGPEGQKLHGAAATQLDGYREFLEASWSEETQWVITVYSVLSTRKAAIKAEASLHTLPALRSWLEQKRPESWFIGRRYLQFGVSEFTDELAVRETHNDRVVDQREFLKDAG